MRILADLFNVAGIVFYAVGVLTVLRWTCRRAVRLSAARRARLARTTALAGEDEVLAMVADQCIADVRSARPGRRVPRPAAACIPRQIQADVLGSIPVDLIASLYDTPEER